MGPLRLDLNGAPSGSGFVIVSSPPQPLPGTLTLRTMDGSEGDMTLRPAAGSAGALTIKPDAVHVSGAPTTVQVLAGAASAAQNDAVIEVVEGDAVVARLELTALAEPRVRFRGRFQCRLATNGDPYNEPWGTAASGFRMYAVHGATRSIRTRRRPSRRSTVSSGSTIPSPCAHSANRSRSPFAASKPTSAGRG
jgi:hypothetical protein